MTDAPHQDIAKLFLRDPLSLTDSDITIIIEDMRKKRHLFKTAPDKVAGGSKKPKLTEKEKAASVLDIKLDL